MIFNIAAEVYNYGMIAVSVYFLIMAVANVLDMRKRTSLPAIKEGPLVSVLIPARDEEQNIENCVNSLLKQDYRDYEILIIDDNSEDSTFAIIQNLEKQNSRVKAYRGKPLPADWYGKAFALEQLVSKANGEILLFTDADTIHNPTSISWAVTNLKNTGADFISGYVGQILKSFGERVTVPVMFFLTGFIIPMFLNKIVKLGYFSAAVGQYIAVKKEVFKNIGGYEAVKSKTSEDVYMARYIKECGYKTEFLDITDQVYCRMYDGYWASIQGIGKNIYDFLGKKPPALFFIAFLIFFFFVLPFPILVCSIPLFFLGFVSRAFLINLAIVFLLFSVTWLVLFIGRRISWYNAFVWPILYVNLFFMVIWSFYRTVSHRGFIWKHRVVN
jgi:chlorobactene glucosyltransferase